jgi:glycosyltransferase involved in cell wall biosynthesis
MGDPVRRVTVIAPMLDEAAHVEDLVADLAAQDFAGELEIFIADGGSTDGSRALLETAATRAGLALTVIDNPRRIVATGLNDCIRRATGDLIARIDCHSRYPSDYLRRCVEAAEATDAWNVGGVARAEGRTRTERAVAAAMDSPFGGISWTRDSTASGRVEADTVFCGAFRPIAFERVGLFDETLVRNQDDELNLRIRLAGGSIVFDPSIRASYTPRGRYRSLYRQYYEYGRWKIAVMRKHRRVASARSLAPIALVGSLAALSAAAPASGRARALLAGEAAVYAACAVGAAIVAARGRHEPASLVPRVAAVFPVFHIGYGLGMAAGIVAAARKRQTL